ncbi:L-lactate dehydrogenase-like [Agrilus planipennis]|uniref:L-lactate dehydrogenase-like n=1 Tax=Agrilus planipennis TaxID=224129 RepID=A0A1W4XHD3_AGRPL|nr:L-lactate dehydrogenase-like [Agrilus planipennis]
MLTTTVKALMTYVCPSAARRKNRRDKVTIIGAGSVGVALAYTLLTQKKTSELVLIDKSEEQLQGEHMDMIQGAMFMESPRITSTTDYHKTVDSCVVIITVGAVMQEDENEMDAAKRNAEILKEIVPAIVKESPEAVVVVMTQPVDICSYIVWKLSKFPAHRVIGSGTCLQSANFKSLIAERLGVSPSAVQACIIGEPGQKSIPVWSGVTICGVRLKDINADIGTDEDPEDWNYIHKEIVKNSNCIKSIKGHEALSMAQAMAKITSAILEDTRECMPVSTHIRGCRHKDSDAGDRKDVYLSLPCILSSCGVSYIVRQQLTEKEKNLLQKSADKMNEIQSGLDLTLSEMYANK